MLTLAQRGRLLCGVPAGCPDAECPGFHSALSELSPSSLSSSRRAGVSLLRLCLVSVQTELLKMKKKMFRHL